jgi:predicted enzyme related to lactoylglutathione lyase
VRANITALAFVLGLAGGLLTASQQPKAPPLPAERVTGIGGVFFKARDAKALSVWYREKLGVAIRPEGEFSVFEWRERDSPERVGTTVWALFRPDSTYFGPSGVTFMINYRVRDLDGMLAQLRAQGVAVEPKVSEEFNGRFAWVLDPEGNRIELWEPKEGF